MKEIPKKFEKRIVAFIDILGFEEHEQNDEMQQKILNILYKIRSLSSSFKVQIKRAINEHGSISEGIFISLDIISFSDHMIISAPLMCPIDHRIDEYIFCSWVLNALIRIISKLYQYALTLGVALRGAVALGEVHYDGSKNIIMGNPLIEAIKAEQKTAIYPRVEICKSLFDFFNKCHKPWMYYLQMLRRDFDGIYYIDYLTEIFCPKTHKKVNIKVIKGIRETIEKNILIYRCNFHILAKWYWLANYFDIALKNCSYCNSLSSRNLPKKIKTFSLLEWNLENRSETFKKKLPT